MSQSSLILISLLLSLFPHLAGLGNWNYDPKYLLLISTLPFLLFYLRHKRRFHPVWALLILFGFVSSLGATNPGVSFYKLSFFIFLWGLYEILSSSKMDVKFLGRIILGVNLVLIFESFLQIFFRQTLVFQDFLFLSFLGSKNAQSIWFAITLPLLMGQLTNSKRIIKILTSLLIVSQGFIIFSFRTRSAWWLLIFLFMHFLIQVIRDQRNRKSFTLFSVGLLTGFVLFLILPTKLHWVGDSPYLMSFKTMTSLEHSSGRWELWKIALHMLKLSQPFGVGLENFYVLFKHFVSSSGIDPEIINNLRYNQYVLNDYLEALVEGGPLFFITFTYLFLVIPFKTFWISFKTKNQENQILALTLILISFNAFIDLPFNTPALPVLFVICLSGLHLSPKLKSWPKWPLRLAGTFSFALALIIALSFVLRLPMFGNRFLKISHDLWKWDQYWDERALSHLSPLSDESYVLERQKLWPYDERTDYLAGIFYFKKDADKGLPFLAYSVGTRYQGRCHFENFKKVTAIGIPLPLDIELKCTQPAMKILIGEEFPVRISKALNLVLTKKKKSDQFELNIKSLQGTPLLNKTLIQERFSLTFFHQKRALLYLEDQDGNRKFKLHLWDLDDKLEMPIQGAPLTQTAAPKIQLSKDDEFFTYFHDGFYHIYRLREAEVQLISRIQDQNISKLEWIDDVLFFVTPQGLRSFNPRTREFKDLQSLNKKIVSFTHYGPELVILHKDQKSYYLSGMKLSLAHSWEYPFELHSDSELIYLATTEGMTKHLYLVGLDGSLTRLLSAPEFEIQGDSILLHSAHAPPQFYSLREVSARAKMDSRNIRLRRTTPSPSVEYAVLTPEVPSRGDLVYLHGGPHLRESYAFDERMNDLMKAGFRIIKINYRGSLGYGEAFASYTWKKAKLQVEDVHQVVKELRLKRFTLLGESYGSYLGYRYLEKYQHEVSKAVFLSSSSPYDRTFSLEGIPHAFFIGMNDEITPPMKLLESLKKMKGFNQKHFYLFSNEGHAVRRLSNWHEVFEKINSL